MPALDQLQRLLQNGQRLQAEEVELHETCGFDIFPVELRDRHVRARIAIDRHELVERAIADHHAGGVRRRVAIEAFELLRDLQQARDDRFVVALLLQLGFAGNGVRQRDRIGGIVRHELAEAVDLPVRHLQHAADVAQHRARLQLSVRDDLRHAIVAVLVLNVANDLVAPVLAEVDVEVRHRHALGIEKALEEQTEAQRIEIRDRERPGNERACTRATARPDGNAVRLGPFDEVRNDQEVARELHSLDDANLVLKALLVVLPREARRERVHFEPLDEAFLGLTCELRVFRSSTLFSRCVGLGLHEIRQNGLASTRTIRAAPRDLDRARKRLRQIGEHLGHGLGALEGMLWRQAAAVVLIEIAALGNAQQRVVCLVVFRIPEIALVGRDERQILVVGDVDELRFDELLARDAMPLKLDIETIAEDVLELLHARCRDGTVVIRKGFVDRAVRTAGQYDQALGMLRYVADPGIRRLAIARAHVGAARYLKQIAVTDLAHGEKREQAIAMRRWQCGKAGDARTGSVDFLEIDSEAYAGDRLNAAARELVRELERAEQIVRVGQRERGKAELGRPLGQRADRQRAFEQRIGRMHFEVHERRGGGRRGNRLCHAGKLPDRIRPPKGSGEYACPAWICVGCA